jgi:hypothetical protein
MKNHFLNNQKSFWIIGGILLLILICSLATWLGGGMAEMMKNHMGG